MNTEKRVSIVFLKENVKGQFKQKDRLIDIIEVPSTSKTYGGFIWYYPHDWINQSKFDEKEVYLSLKDSTTVKLYKREKQGESYVTLEEEIVNPDLLKKIMSKKKTRKVKKKDIDFK